MDEVGNDDSSKLVVDFVAALPVLLLNVENGNGVDVYGADGEFVHLVHVHVSTCGDELVQCFLEVVPGMKVAAVVVKLLY